jgi:hypothetical protein
MTESRPGVAGRYRNSIAILGEKERTVRDGIGTMKINIEAE